MNCAIRSFVIGLEGASLTAARPEEGSAVTPEAASAMALEAGPLDSRAPGLAVWELLAGRRFFFGGGSVGSPLPLLL